MRHSHFARLGSLLAAASLAACSLLPSGTPSATPPPTLVPTATLAPSATPTSTLAVTSTSTSAPSANSTQTPTPDPLAAATLKLEDLPPGFTALTPDDRARLHFSDDDIIAAYGNVFAADQLHNVAGFILDEDPDYQVVLVFLFYPLGGLQQVGVDLTLSDPQLFQKAFVKGAGIASQEAGATVTAKPLAGMDKFGDRSAGGAAVVTTSEGQVLHLDVVAVRRGDILEVYNSVYPDKANTPASLSDIVKLVDPRVAAVKP